MSRLSSELSSSLQVGRFSTQLLQQSGAQKEVRTADGAVVNQYANARGSEVFADPGSVNLSPGKFTKSAYSINTFTAVRSYFESRGASSANADTMAALTMDVARSSGQHPISLLDYNSKGSTSFNAEIMNYLNRYRPNGQQQDVYEDTSNKRDSIKSRLIRG